MNRKSFLEKGVLAGIGTAIMGLVAPGRAKAAKAKLVPPFDAPMWAQVKGGYKATYYDGHIIQNGWSDASGFEGSCACEKLSCLPEGHTCDLSHLETVSSSTWEGPYETFHRTGGVCLKSSGSNKGLPVPLIARIGGKLWGIDIVLDQYGYVSTPIYCKKDGKLLCGNPSQLPS